MYSTLGDSDDKFSEIAMRHMDLVCQKNLEEYFRKGIFLSFRHFL
jgi:hypothetical protein